jgi:hypothetical protein
MPYYAVIKLVPVTKTNMINKMLCGYVTPKCAGVRLLHQVFIRACAEHLAAHQVPHRAFEEITATVEVGC